MIIYACPLGPNERHSNRARPFEEFRHCPQCWPTWSGDVSNQTLRSPFQWDVSRNSHRCQNLSHHPAVCKSWRWRAVFLETFLARLITFLAPRASAGREGTERILWYAMCTLEATPLLTVAKSREIHQAAPWYEAASTSKRLVISYDLPTSLSDLHTKSPHWRAFWIGLLAQRCLTLCESNTARENPSVRLQRQNHPWIQRQLVNFPLPGFIQQETQVGAGAGHTANRLNRYPISLLPLSNPLLPFTVRSILLTFIST